jgi:zinc D-Ala-D-Ala carboxypeptidase
MSYFSDSETMCRCGCGMNITRQLLIKLNEAREVSAVPFVITSGARCVSHNRSVGGTPNSSHIRGLAVDIACPSSQARFAILKGLYAAGFRRIGYNQAKNFFHCDIDESLTQDVFFEY